MSAHFIPYGGTRRPQQLALALSPPHDNLCRSQARIGPLPHIPAGYSTEWGQAHSSIMLLWSNKPHGINFWSCTINEHNAHVPGGTITKILGNILQYGGNFIWWLIESLIESCRQVVFSLSYTCRKGSAQLPEQDAETINIHCLAQPPLADELRGHMSHLRTHAVLSADFFFEHSIVVFWMRTGCISNQILGWRHLCMAVVKLARSNFCWLAMYLAIGTLIVEPFTTTPRMARKSMANTAIITFYLLGIASTPCRRCWSWWRHLWGQPGWDRSLTPAKLSCVNASTFQSQDSAIRLTGAEYQYHWHYCTRVIKSRNSHDIRYNFAHHSNYCSFLWDISINLITNTENFVATLFRAKKNELKFSK